MREFLDGFKSTSQRVMLVVLVALVAWAWLSQISDIASGDSCADRGGYVITGTRGEEQCSVGR
jgi:hypothetical protein